MSTNPALLQLGTQVFWQWINQSYNTMFNHANRNASNPMSNEDVLKSYAAAVAVSCGASVGFNYAFNKATFLSAGTRSILHLVRTLCVAVQAPRMSALTSSWPACPPVCSLFRRGFSQL